MTEDEKDNEQLKLFVGWVNTLSTGIIVAGTFVPALNYVYEILPQTAQGWHIYGGAIICVVVGIVLHIGGQLILSGGLK